MKRLLVSAVLAFASLALSAQSYRIVIPDGIPSEASEILLSRFTQMLESVDITVEDDAPNSLLVNVTVVDRMITQGSISQVALILAVTATPGEGLPEAVFNVRGVGEDDADAMARAVKQILPRSRQAVSFARSLKNDEN